MKELAGTGVALATPFDRSGKIDYTGLKKLLTHTASGVDYYVVMGTTGESVTISEEEKAAVLEFVKENNPKKLPIVYGLGGNNTRHALELLDRFDPSGVSAILSVGPYYNKPSQAGIIKHFTALANRSPLPIMLYNVPGRTGANMTSQTTLTLAQHKNIIGIKEASGDISQCIRIAKGKPKNFLLISGDDMLTLPLLSVGGEGVISVLANAYPVTFRKMVDAFIDRQPEKAAQELYKFIALNPLIYEEGSASGLKEVLQELGICGNYTRLPMTPVSANLRKRIREAMKGIGGK